MATAGTIVRFDDIRGYGFIAPANGGEDVFVHANDLGDQRHLVYPGSRVEYEVEQGERGLKVASVRVLDSPAQRPVDRRPPNGEERSGSAAADEEGMCDALASGEFIAEVTEILLQRVPSLTGAQIVQVRECLLERARSHGWIET